MVPQPPNSWIVLTIREHQEQPAAQAFKEHAFKVGHAQVDWIEARETPRKPRGRGQNWPRLLLLLTGDAHQPPECDYFLKPMFAWTVWPVVGIVTQIVTPHDGSLVVFFELSCSTY